MGTMHCDILNLAAATVLAIVLHTATLNIPEMIKDFIEKKCKALRDTTDHEGATLGNNITEICHSNCQKQNHCTDYDRSKVEY